MRDGTAYVQAGGKVVADSNGPYEYTEAANKARAVLGGRRRRDPGGPMIRLGQPCWCSAAGGLWGRLPSDMGDAAKFRRARAADLDDRWRHLVHRADPDSGAARRLHWRRWRCAMAAAGGGGHGGRGLPGSGLSGYQPDGHA